MPLRIVRNDITRMHTEAIVNAANQTLLGGGGVDGAIHRAAGPALKEACRQLGGCRTGEVRLTPGFDLPAGHVIHTVGPLWRGGGQGEDKLLRACYTQSLLLAYDEGFKSIAFPLISAGAYGYPGDRALAVATEAIAEFLMTHEMDVYLVVYDAASFQLEASLFSSLEGFLDERFVAPRDPSEPKTMPRELFQLEPEVWPDYRPQASLSAPVAGGLEELIEEADETFSSRLLRLIDERGMTDAEAYRRANVDRRLFSKIRSNAGYHPSKATVLCFSLALGLDLDETEDLLRSAGYAFSPSSRRDIIVEYFIRNGPVDIFLVNEALFAFGEKTLVG